MSTKIKLAVQLGAIYADSFVGFGQTVSLGMQFLTEKDEFMQDHIILWALVMWLIGKLSETSLATMQLVNDVQTMSLPKVEHFWRESITKARDLSRFRYKLDQIPAFSLAKTRMSFK